MHGFDTIEDGIHTYDIYKEGVSKEKVGTKEFAAAVVKRMGQKPEKLKSASYSKEAAHRKEWTPSVRPQPTIGMVGCDFFVGTSSKNGKEFGDALHAITHDGLELTMVDNRGTAVWPEFMEETFLTDSFRCRFTNKADPQSTVTHEQIFQLAQKVTSSGYDIVKIETLRNYDGKPGFTLAQGQ